MRTQLLERHRPLFHALTSDEVTFALGKILQTWPDDVPTPACVEGGDDLFVVCQAAGLDQARVIVSMAGEPGALARSTVEKLIGRPIVPWSASVEEAQAKVLALRAGSVRLGRPQREPKRDTRIVIRVVNNPHKEGTVMHAAYRHWAVNETVQACLDRGLPKRSVRRDVRFGHVLLGAPQS